MPASPADSSPSSPVKATLPSPWAAVVRGDDDKEPTPPPPASSPSLATPDLALQRAPELLPSDDYREAAYDGNVGHGKAGRPAWKALPNGAIEASAGKDVDGMIGGGGGGSSGVMGDDVAWPALSLSTRASSKSLSSDSSASANLSKAQAEGSPSNAQGLVLPNSPQRLATNNSGSPKAAENSIIPQRRKPSRRSDAGAVTNSSSLSNSGAASNSGGSWQLPGGFNHPQLVPPMPPCFPSST
ncbi:hypothetical protein MLD38_012839 [Melastoma candidum]|uniref:Uncharacterized protein n=1 Tax=Melastoma candidum TaxID=119954 RepID=A0ACB9RAR8_9MYRT|nr:hypothetical protein MLD38_012839 [Melastoma candidum]